MKSLAVAHDQIEVLLIIEAKEKEKFASPSITTNQQIYCIHAFDRMSTICRHVKCTRKKFCFEKKNVHTKKKLNYEEWKR